MVAIDAYEKTTCYSFLNRAQWKRMKEVYVRARLPVETEDLKGMSNSWDQVLFKALHGVDK